MKPRYFQSAFTIWKFTDEGNFCRSLINDAGWIDAVSCIEDMTSGLFIEITEEDGEP